MYDCPVCGEFVNYSVANDGDDYYDVWGIYCPAGCDLTIEQEQEIASAIYADCEECEDW